MKVIRVIDCLIQIIDDDIVPAQVFKRVRCDLRLIQNPTPAFYHLRKKRLVGVGLNLRSEEEMTSTSKKKSMFYLSWFKQNNPGVLHSLFQVVALTKNLPRDCVWDWFLGSCFRITPKLVFTTRCKKRNHLCEQARRVTHDI